MTEYVAAQRINRGLSRINDILLYIETHLDEPLTVESLAEKSCWSRWQFQRVFQREIGMGVAQYIRSLRLSRAGQLLLTTKRRQMDIALACGFESEISLSSSFRKAYDCSPGQYRKAGIFRNLHQPIVSLSDKTVQETSLPPSLFQVRIETLPARRLQGIKGHFDGIFSKHPNHMEAIPAIWATLMKSVSVADFFASEHIGVIDFSERWTTDNIPYWACLSREDHIIHPTLDSIELPEHTYAVLPCSNNLASFDKILTWFLCSWLPESNYQGVEHYELEHYGQGLRQNDTNLQLEYWMPVVYSDAPND
ncbi:helix-turn-helix domain-containing protein [Endozoicomonas ascidiicola]|uniref:helix-turn-helix domain-containing protein n=1 Tax=Endozoicomonas ascidiicola TaxID=1698521 RepID=UPI00082FDBF8|nr:helix-turn-helix domain-containing protein [Endozoicomonas ascidiicola]